MKNFTLLLVLFFCRILSNHAATCTWTGAVNNLWSEAGNWSCGQVPGATDDVIISNAAVTLDAAASITSLNMEYSQLVGGNNVSISGALTLNVCTLGGAGSTTVGGFATLVNTNVLDARTLTLNGDAEVNGAVTANNSANLVINGTMTSNTVGNHAWGGSGGTLTLNGTFIRNGSGYIAFDSYVFQNTGTVTLNQGGFFMGFYGWNGTHSGATINLAAGVAFAPNGGTHTFTGCTINGTGYFGAGSTISTFTGNTVASTVGMASSGGTFTIGQDLNIASWEQFPGGTVNGTSNITVNGNFTQTGGTFSPNGNVTINGNLLWSGGTIGGTGAVTVAGTTTVTNVATLARTFVNPATGTITGNGTLDMSAGNFSNSGNFAPGTSPGIFTLIGTYATNGGDLNIEIGGTTPGTEYDRLAVSGAAILSGGDINLSLVNGYTPQVGHSFTILDATSLTGTFATPTDPFVFAGANWGIVYDNAQGTITLNVMSLLPVELVDFQASLHDNKMVSLNWWTASELNNEGFHVERSTDGREWLEIGFVAGNGTTTEKHDYSFFDEKPTASTPLEGEGG